MTAAPIRLAVVAGEESGDLLGADLVRALAAASGRHVELFGVGGRHLAELGLNSLFDSSEIALMGFAAVMRDLPRLLMRIGKTARAVAEFDPDCLITIDSPAFGLRVARKVKASRPAAGTIHYVCPSVWAWAPGRAKTMAGFVDHVLCLLPFEPAELKRLGGPPGSFVGHRLARHPLLTAAAEARAARTSIKTERPTILLLPGSRRSEVRSLMEPFRQVIEQLARRHGAPDLVLPTVPHVAGEVREALRSWGMQPRIVEGEEAKYAAFAEADVAIAASGTVLLELAIAGVPAVSCYRTDIMLKALRRMVTVWSAALPNLIADRPIVPEFIDEMLRPQTVVHTVEELLRGGHLRDLQLEGYREVRAALATPRPAGELAAEIVLGQIAARDAGWT